MSRHYDYLICGQGLAGSLLARQLIKAGKKVLVMDAGSRNTSSHVAAGMFTPISGKRMVKSWMTDELYPVMTDTYRQLENELGLSFLHLKNIQLSFSSIKEQNDFFSALTDKTSNYVLTEIVPNPGLQAPFGAVEITHSGWLNTSLFLDKFKAWLIEQQAYEQQCYAYESFLYADDQWHYGTELCAGAVVFCEGSQNSRNPFFKYAGVIENKGDVFLLETNALDDEKIYKRGAYAVHLEQNRFKAGSTYKWNEHDATPTSTGYAELKAKTDALISGNYQVLEHLAGIRPTTRDRRPILGGHHTEAGLYIFNGLGTKGVSLAPYFSKIMADLLLNGTILPAEIDVKRFT
ncbi:MAG: FAD-dependent oxidoreductase [Bacteroidota bacterium]